MILLRFPEGKEKVLTLSYDDGTRHDIRMCEILGRHGIKCTFNLNGGKMANKDPALLTFEEAKALYTAGGHEVACHGYTHEYLLRIPASGTVYDVMRDRVLLENEFGTMVRGFAYPYSVYSDETVAALRSCGIVHARGGDSSYDFTLPKDFMRLRPTVRHADPRLMELARSFAEKKVTYDPIFFLLMGHSFEFDRSNNWHVLEEFAAFMGERKDVWYATVGELQTYMEAYSRLVWSADTSRVYNPTESKIFLQKNGTLYSVAPGETLAF